MKKFRSKIKRVLGNVFNHDNAHRIISELIDVLAGMAVILGAVDKSPKAQAICKAVQLAKQIKDRQNEPDGREVLGVTK